LAADRCCGTAQRKLLAGAEIMALAGEQDRRLLFGFQLDPMRAVSTRRRMLIGVLNAAKIVNAHQDELLRRSLVECDVLLADGQSVVWASRLLGRPLPERVAGIDLFEELLRLADAERRSVFFLGATPDVLTRLIAVIEARFPNVRIAGSQHGYFKDEDSEQVAGEIAASGADMLFIGMTSPRKEVFLGRFGPTLNVPILHGVGGSFDIFAGQTKRAPVLWQRTGMEWAYRVLQEPRRLWWRYLSTNSAFVLMTLNEWLRPARAFEQSGLANSASNIRHI
jgi:N-acetylglucosaminyldiphosphoundecaprenol N-acetyl-beta-D-mannosaminyltransferase